MGKSTKLEVMCLDREGKVCCKCDYSDMSNKEALPLPVMGKILECLEEGSLLVDARQFTHCLPKER